MSPKLYASKNGKVVLIADVTDAPFKCNVCRKVFISDGYLKRHQERRHPSFNISPEPRASKIKEIQSEPTRNDPPSIQAVLNATERIEYLLANLTYGSDAVNKCSLIGNETKGGIFSKTSHKNINKKFVHPHKFDSNQISSSHLSNDTHVNLSLPQEDGPSSQSGSVSPSHPLEKDSVDKTFDLPVANSTLLEINYDSLEDIGSYLEDREFSEDSPVESGSSRREFSEDSPVESGSCRREFSGDSRVGSGKSRSLSGHEQASKPSAISEESTCYGVSNTVHQQKDARNVEPIYEEQSNMDVDRGQILEKTYTCLNPKENEVFQRMISPEAETFKLNNEYIGTNVDKNNVKVEKALVHVQEPLNCLVSHEGKFFPELGSTDINHQIPECNRQDEPPGSILSNASRKLISSEKESFYHNETLTDAHLRLKENVLFKLNAKLRSFGVDPNWDKIPDKTAVNVEQRLRSERAKIIKHNPDYNKLRDLINHNVNTRIKMSLKS